jgi:hypothetical protein
MLPQSNRNGDEPKSLLFNTTAAERSRLRKRNIYVKKHLLLSAAAAAMLFAGVGVASAQSEGSASVPAWTAEQGQTLTANYEQMHYESLNDPALHPEVGTVLPDTVHVYPLPDGMTGVAYKSYSYAMVNDHPVVVVTTTRKVVYGWN